MPNVHVGGRVFSGQPSHWRAFRGCEPDCPACQLDQERAERDELAEALALTASLEAAADAWAAALTPASTLHPTSEVPF